MLKSKTHISAGSVIVGYELGIAKNVHTGETGFDLPGYGVVQKTTLDVRDALITESGHVMVWGAGGTVTALTPPHRERVAAHLGTFRVEPAAEPEIRPVAITTSVAPAAVAVTEGPPDPFSRRVSGSIRRLNAHDVQLAALDQRVTALVAVNRDLFRRLALADDRIATLSRQLAEARAESRAKSDAPAPRRAAFPVDVADASWRAGGLRFR